MNDTLLVTSTSTPSYFSQALIIIMMKKKSHILQIGALFCISNFMIQKLVTANNERQIIDKNDVFSGKNRFVSTESVRQCPNEDAWPHFDAKNCKWMDHKNRMNMLFCHGLRMPCQLTEIALYEFAAVTITDPYYGFRNETAECFSLPFMGGIALFDSCSVDEEKSDVLSMRVVAAPLTPPTVALAYFETIDQWQFVFNQTSVEDNLEAGIFTSAAIALFDSVVEYYDVNHDGVYTPENDVIVQEINLDAQVWDTFCMAPDSLKHLSGVNISTIRRFDSLVTYVPFSLQVTLSDVIGVMHGDAVSPRAADISIEILDFPYLGYNSSDDTRLAVHMFLASGSSNLTARWAASLEDGSRVVALDENIDNSITFSWNSNAAAVRFEEKEQISFDAHVRLSDFSNHTEKFPGLAERVFFEAVDDVQLDRKSFYINFDAQQPYAIRLQHTFTSGRVVAPTTVAYMDKAILILAFLSIMLTFGGVGWVVYRYRLEKSEHERHEPLLEDDVSNVPYVRVGQRDQGQ